MPLFNVRHDTVSLFLLLVIVHHHIQKLYSFANRNKHLFTLFSSGKSSWIAMSNSTYVSWGRQRAGRRWTALKAGDLKFKKKKKKSFYNTIYYMLTYRGIWPYHQSAQKILDCLPHLMLLYQDRLDLTSAHTSPVSYSVWLICYVVCVCVCVCVCLPLCFCTCLFRTGCWSPSKSRRTPSYLASSPIHFARKSKDDEMTQKIWPFVFTSVH